MELTEYTQFKKERAKQIYEDACQYRESGDFEKAERFFESAYEIDSTNKYVFRELLEIYNDNNEFKKSISLFKRLIQLNPSESNYYLYGKFLKENNKLKHSILYLRKSLQLKKTFLPSHLLLADIYLKLKQKDKALLYLKNSYSLDSSNSFVLENLYELFYIAKKHGDSLKYLNEYLKINPIDQKKVLKKIVLLIKLNYLNEAFSILKNLFESENNLIFINKIQNNQLILTADDKNQIEKLTALRISKVQEFQSNPQNKKSLLLELSLINLLLGQTRKSLMYILHALQLNAN